MILIKLLFQIRDLVNNGSELAAQARLNIVCGHCYWLHVAVSLTLNMQLLGKESETVANSQLKN